jgi:formate/nitrite transporter FocA (FNT family)
MLTVEVTALGVSLKAMWIIWPLSAILNLDGAMLAKLAGERV